LLYGHIILSVAGVRYNNIYKVPIYIIYIREKLGIYVGIVLYIYIYNTTCNTISKSFAFAAANGFAAAAAAEETTFVS